MKKSSVWSLIVLIMTLLFLFYFDSGIKRETRITLTTIAVLLGLLVVILDYILHFKKKNKQEILPKNECTFLQAPGKLASIITLEKRYQIYSENENKDKVLLCLDNEYHYWIEKEYIKLI